MNCKICDQKMIDDVRFSRKEKYDCNCYYSCQLEHYTICVRDDEPYCENFYYGNMKIQVVYNLNRSRISYYCLYYDKDSSNYFSLLHLNFDPKNPETVLNKIKTYFLFS
jgi:hypothetical protein